jgi:nicotinamide riboside kinase
MSRTNASAITVAIVGAESTGKTTLAQQLAASLAASVPGTHPRRVAWVPETLRLWCEEHGRTPRAHEQRPIMREHHRRIRAAAGAHDVVVCDTTALMTAVYSRILFGDRSLDEEAVALHREISQTLLTSLDLPWQHDALRDGPHVREPVDDALRDLLHGHGIAYSVLAGKGAHRLAQAVHAVRVVRPGSGLFTRLAKGGADEGGRRWICDCCVPEAEQALLRQPRRV